MKTGHAIFQLVFFETNFAFTSIIGRSIIKANKNPK